MSEQIVIARPDPSALVAEFSPVAAKARALIVADADAHGEALGAIKTLRSVEKKIEELRFMTGGSELNLTEGWVRGICSCGWESHPIPVPDLTLATEAWAQHAVDAQ